MKALILLAIVGCANGPYENLYNSKYICKSGKMYYKPRKTYDVWIESVLYSDVRCTENKRAHERTILEINNFRPEQTDNGVYYGGDL